MPPASQIHSRLVTAVRLARDKFRIFSYGNQRIASHRAFGAYSDGDDDGLAVGLGFRYRF
jgi:hypothetical protein